MAKVEFTPEQFAAGLWFWFLVLGIANIYISITSEAPETALTSTVGIALILFCFLTGAWALNIRYRIVGVTY